MATSLLLPPDAGNYRDAQVCSRTRLRDSVSLAHAYPGTDFYNFVEANGYLRSDIEMTDETGHQLPHVEYPGLSVLR